MSDAKLIIILAASITSLGAAAGLLLGKYLS